MYVTKFDSRKNAAFDWHTYFSEKDFAGQTPLTAGADQQEILSNIRQHLKENHFLMTLTLTKVMRRLLKGVSLPGEPRILELGAGTGFVTKWLLNQYPGRAVLVDNNQASYEYYAAQPLNDYPNIEYLRQDIFALDLPRAFDIVCSFGLLEHFKDKKDILRAHTRFLKPGGYIIILVPLDSILNRVYWEAHPELNLGYRELLTEREFQAALTEQGLSVVRTVESSGYTFDFVAALCTC